MPSRSDVHRTFAVLVLAVLTACGGGGGGGSGLALDEQVGLDQAGIVQRQIQAENLIRDCMRAQGFEYRPVDPKQRQAALVGTAGLTPEDFEKQFGYGITTLYEQNRRLRADSAAAAGVPAADQAAYDRALFGERTDATVFEALDSGDFSRLGGCSRQAVAQVFGGAEVLQSLQSKLDELDQRVASDPRMVTAVAAWSGCMRAAGYDLARPDDVDAVLAAKLEAIVGPPERSGAVVAYDQAALASLQREEVAMVAADVSCEHKHLSDVEGKVQDEAEQAFREQNADLLTRIPKP